MLLLVCVSDLARKVPTNYILLVTFTLLEAYMVASCCALVTEPLLVLAAAGMTAVIVVGLTGYAYFTKTDFTPLGGSMTVVLFSLMAFGFVCIFFGPTMHLIYCLLGVIVFGIYLVMDT